jgi:hypothetical protein
MSKKLIALIATAVMVDGQRTIFQPGEELPPQSAHDARELVASGAAEDPEQTADLEKQAKKEAAAAAKEFKQARAKVQEKAESIAPEQSADGETASTSTTTVTTPAKAEVVDKK